MEFPADILLAASGAPYFAHYRLGTRAGLLALSMIDDHWAPRPATAHLCAAFDTEPVIDALDQLEDGARPDHFSWLRQPSTAAAWVHAQLGS